MNRADFWCRVIGWVQMAGAAAFAVAVLFLWNLFADIFSLAADTPLAAFVWLFIAIMAFPVFLSGLLTVIYANAVEQSHLGLRGQQKVFLRVILALSGFWAAGVIGFAGLSLPPVSLLSLLALASAVIAIAGPDWTADLMKRREAAP